MQGEPRVVHVAPHAGERVWVADELLTFVISGEQTGGAYALTDSTVPPGGEVPPHVHSREDEAFRVLDGRLEVTAGEQTFVSEAGSFVHLPRGVAHTFKNVGPGPARFLTLIVPAGLEGFFREVGNPGSGSVPPLFGEEQVQRLLEAAPRYGVEILTPEG